jgi:hypothetical protein
VSAGGVIDFLQLIRPKELNMAWTDVCMCLCMQGTYLEHVNTFLIGYRSDGTPGEP